MDDPKPGSITIKIAEYMTSHEREFTVAKTAEREAFFYNNPDIEFNVALSQVCHKGSRVRLFKHKPTEKFIVYLKFPCEGKEAIKFWLDPGLSLANFNIA